MAETTLSAKLILAVVMLLLLSVCFLLTRMWNEDDIARVQADLRSLERERDSIVTVVAANVAVQQNLRLQVIALQDSIATLHVQNALALRTGYDNASNEYRNLSTRHIAELRKPRFSLGSTVGLCLGAAGAGVVIGALVR